MEANKKTRRAFNSKELGAIKSHLTERMEELWKEILHDLERDEIELKHNELTMIEDVLESIDKGEYGLCLDCKRWISRARLEAFPFAVRCRDCQAKHEMRES
jgi:RNA polymerase-binding transcription factor DksA